MDPASCFSDLDPALQFEMDPDPTVNVQILRLSYRYLYLVFWSWRHFFVMSDVVFVFEFKKLDDLSY